MKQLLFFFCYLYMFSVQGLLYLSNKKIMSISTYAHTKHQARDARLNKDQAFTYDNSASPSRVFVQENLLIKNMQEIMKRKPESEYQFQHNYCKSQAHQKKIIIVQSKKVLSPSAFKKTLFSIPQISNMSNSPKRLEALSPRMQKAITKGKSEKNPEKVRRLDVYSPKKINETKTYTSKPKQNIVEKVKRAQNLSPRFQCWEEDQVQPMKNSKIIQRNKSQQIIENFKLVRSNISTSSSNKSIKELQIIDFELGRELGKGKFGCVRMAKHKKTGLIFSVKIISKQMVKQDNTINQLIKEIKIQSFLNHSHIVKLYSVFDDKQNIYLLLQFCCEGNLYEYMTKKGKIKEEEASQFMKQTCDAVQELHSYKIIHRDIKPENIVMSFGMIKICDFGWSTQIRIQKRETFCGSPLYLPPEILKGHLYDQKVDLWALGILCYQMMTGTVPFRITSQRDLIKIIDSKVKYPNWMSSAAISFLKQLLEKNPEDRSNIDQLLGHSFLRCQQIP